MWVQLRPHWLPRTVPVIILGVVYHPPNRNNKEGIKEITDHLITTIDHICSHQPQAGLLLCGDFNGLPLRPLLAAHPELKQIVKQPTRGSATLDIIITNLAQHYSSPRIIPPIGNSDHACVILQSGAQVAKQSSVKLPRRVIKYSMKRVFAVALAMQDWSAVLEAPTVEDKVDKFYSTVMSLVDSHFPVRLKTVQTNDKNWMTKRVQRAIESRQAEFKRHGKSPLWRSLRNKAKTVVRQAKNWYYRNHIQHLKSESPHKWWSCINKELGRSHGSGTRVTTHEQDDGHVAEKISQHFAEAWCVSQCLNMFPLPLTRSCPDLCSIGEVKVLLKATNPRKSCGPDNLPTWVLKEFAEDLAPVVTHVFNASYREGIVPVIWKSANVIPVPKSAGSSEVSNMRPVSLLPVLAKLLEKCVLKRLLPTLRAVIKDQYAYLRGSSTTIALVRMVHTWMSALDSRKPVLIRAVFADMSKAFDRVDHALLLQTVINLQISSGMSAWIHNYLKDRQQRVVANGETSSWRTLTSGVPQGGVISPYLLLLFMSTRRTVHPDTMNVGYADDVTLSRTLLALKADDDRSVEEETSNLDSWASEHRMTLNGGKSQLLQICFCRSVPEPPTLTLGGAPVPVVSSAKGLGFILDQGLTFNEQVNAMVTKASRRLHHLRLLTKQGMSVSDLIQVYLALVRPVLEYGHVLLVGCSKQQDQAIEKVQRRALRIISLGGRRSVPVLPTLRERRELAAVKLLKNMLNPEHPLHDLVPDVRPAGTGMSLRNSGGIRVRRMAE
ncbi:hypothetical protein Bbelb_146470 [Branchiostoma belcheri]|nr:hypothetical protein Bbelb_146470 [Branchiostoma belcheri]